MSVETYPDRESWLFGRTLGIGASETSAALGENPYRSPFSLWAEKCNKLEPEDLSDRECVEWGTRLEGAIVRAVAERFGRQVEHNETFAIHRSDDHEFLTATVDAVQMFRDRSEPGVLEVKCTSEWNRKAWRDGPPLQHVIQAQQQMLCTGLRWGSIVCLLGGNELLGPFEIEYCHEFWNHAIPRLQTFWQHVIDQTPPPIDNSKSTAEAIARLFPFDDGGSIELSGDTESWCTRIVKAREQIKLLTEAKRGYESQLRAELGDASIGYGLRHRVSFPTVEREDGVTYRRLYVKEIV
jgi:putative phage-type endonuclease